MISMCIPPRVSDVRIVNVTYHLVSYSVSTKGWYLKLFCWVAGVGL